MGAGAFVFPPAAGLEVVPRAEELEKPLRDTLVHVEVTGNSICFTVAQLSSDAALGAHRAAAGLRRSAP